MKGITHFLTGLALATFFPEVVNAAEAGSLLPVLGGFAGLLPDFLDFKFVQFWEAYDIELDPGPSPNAETIANSIIMIMHQAYESAKSIHLRAHTIRLDADSWRRYTLEFLPENGEIAVSIGPVMSTSQKPFAGSGMAPIQTARRSVAFPIQVQVQRRFDIDIFHGPSFLFARSGDCVSVRFLDWHRRWTHSLLLASIVGLCTALVTGWLYNWSTALWAGIVCWISYSTHVLADQLGHLGSNVWWPITQQRKPGLGLFHSDEGLPNFLAVWLSLILILFNIDRYGSSYIPTVPYLAVGFSLPLILILAAMARQRRKTSEINEAGEASLPTD